MDTEFKKLFERYSTQQNIRQQSVVEICKYLAVLNFSKKHILIKENQRHDYAYFVVKGAVRSYYMNDGVEVNTWFALENEMVGSLYNFKDNPSRETIELVENATLISINFKQLKPLMRNNIEIANFINAIIEEYALFLEDRIHYSQMKTSMDRYIRLLDHEPQIFQRIPLTYIASYLGITRETLSRLKAR